MFETPKEVEPSASKGLWVVIAVVVVVLGAGGYFMVSKAGKRGPAATAQPASPADAVKDLKVQRTTMNKDRNGTAVWIVTIDNKSDAYTYSKVEYETTYVGADNNALLVNKGTIPGTFAPGEQRNAEIKDAPFPPATSWYKLKITGAASSTQ